MPAFPAGGNDPCNCGAVLQKYKDGLQPAVEGMAPEDRSPFVLKEGELLMVGSGCPFNSAGDRRKAAKVSEKSDVSWVGAAAEPL